MAAIEVGRMVADVGDNRVAAGELGHTRCLHDEPRPAAVAGVVEVLFSGAGLSFVAAWDEKDCCARAFRRVVCVKCRLTRWDLASRFMPATGAGREGGSRCW